MGESYDSFICSMLIVKKQLCMLVGGKQFYMLVSGKQFSLACTIQILYTTK
jgi:hypothetical protein